MPDVRIIFLLCCNFLIYFHASAYNTSELDIVHTRLELEVNWSRKTLSGKATIQYNCTDCGDTLVLDAHQLNISEVYDKNNRHLTFFQDGGHVYIIKALHAAITIIYESQYVDDIDPTSIGGSFGKGLRWITPGKLSPTKKYQLFAQSIQGGCSYWYPCHDTMTDLMTTDIFITVDTSMTAIASGALITQKKLNASQQQFHFKSHHPHTAASTSLIVGRYRTVMQEHGHHKILTYCYEDEYEATKASVVMLPQMMEFIAQETASDYPFESYAQVVVQDYPFPGIAGQHMVNIISDNMVDDYCTHEDYKYLWDGVQANGLFNQWFGQLIIPQSGQDNWLSLALAYYYESLWTARKHGADEYLLWYLPWEMSSLQAAMNATPHAVADSIIANDRSLMYDNIVKYKGAMMLRLLRYEIGDESFRKAIQQFIRQYAFSPSTTQNFIACIEKNYGQSLQWFFDQWIYNADIPDYSLQAQYDSVRQTLDITVHQSLKKPKHHLTGFAGKLELVIDHKPYMISLEAKADNTMSIPMSTAPTSIIPDPHHYYPVSWQNALSMEAQQNILMHSPHVLARKSALIALAENVATKGVATPTADTFSTQCSALLMQAHYWRWKVQLINTMTNTFKGQYSDVYVNTLLHTIKHDSQWVKATAITALGMTGLAAYESVYADALHDCSDRVVSAAAIALGKLGTATAISHLLTLAQRPSWKNQSLMHLINGLSNTKQPLADSVALKALQDVRSPRWYLGNGWDYPYVAAQYLGQSPSVGQALDIIQSRMTTAIQEKHNYDLFYQINLLTLLHTPRVKEIFNHLKNTFANDKGMIGHIEYYVQIWKDNTGFNE